MTQEDFRQGELSGSEFDDPIAHRGAPRPQIESDASGGEDRSLRRGAVPKPQPDAGEQLLEAERLGHVVVGSSLEAGDRVPHVVRR